MDYTQLFYVGLTNPRGFRGVRNGYLPALEPIIESTQVEIPQEAPDWIRKLWDKQIQLHLDQINLRKTLYDTLKEIKERANASKQKGGRIKYE